MVIIERVACFCSATVAQMLPDDGGCVTGGCSSMIVSENGLAFQTMTIEAGGKVGDRDGNGFVVVIVVIFVIRIRGGSRRRQRWGGFESGR